MYTFSAYIEQPREWIQINSVELSFIPQIGMILEAGAEAPIRFKVLDVEYVRETKSYSLYLEQQERVAENEVWTDMEAWELPFIPQIGMTLLKDEDERFSFKVLGIKYSGNTKTFMLHLEEINEDE